MPHRYMPEKFVAEVRVGNIGCPHFSVLCGKLALTPKTGTIRALPAGEHGRPPLCIDFPNTPIGAENFDIGSSLGCPDKCATAALAVAEVFKNMGFYEVAN